MGADSGDQCHEVTASYLWIWTVTARVESTRFLRSTSSKFGHLTGTWQALSRCASRGDNQQSASLMDTSAFSGTDSLNLLAAAVTGNTQHVR